MGNIGKIGEHLNIGKIVEHLKIGENLDWKIWKHLETFDVIWDYGTRSCIGVVGSHMLQIHADSYNATNHAF